MKLLPKIDVAGTAFDANYDAAIVVALDRTARMQLAQGRYLDASATCERIVATGWQDGAWPVAGEPPVGDPARGTGGDSTVFEMYTAYGQLLPKFAFLQLHTGIELPAHTDKVARAYYLRTAIGKTFAADGGHGRRW